MATTKKCSRCNEVKPLDLFSPSKKGLFGRHSRCKACVNEAVKLRYSQHPEVRERAKERAKVASQGQRAKAYRKQLWQQVKDDEHRKASRRERIRSLYHSDPVYRMKVKARSLVAWALQKGKLQKPPHCEQCNIECGELEGHHYAGYWPRSAWLMVKWLCPACHAAADVEQATKGRKLFMGEGLPEFAELSRRFGQARRLLGLDDAGLMAAAADCVGEDEMSTMLNVIDWLAKRNIIFTTA